MLGRHADRDVHHVAVDLEVAGPVLVQSMRSTVSWTSRATSSGWRRMRALQVTSERIRHCASTSFTWWWMPAMRASAAPGPPETTSSGTISA